MTRLQRFFKLAFSILIALIISMTGLFIPGVPLINNEVAEAHLLSQSLSPVLVKNTLRTLRFLGKAGSFLVSVDSFLPDISLIKASFSPTLVFSPTLAFSPVLSLIGRIDFFFKFQEINLIKINIGDQPSLDSAALEDYKRGVEQAQEKGDYRGAVKHYSDALSKDGNFAEAYVSRGRAYSELAGQQSSKPDYTKSLKRAIADYTKALEVKPKFAPDPNRYVEPLLGRGAVYIKLDNYQAALSDFNLAIERNPDFYDAYLGRATIYSKEEVYQKAIEDIDEALALTADYPAASFRRGSIKGELGDYEEAIKDFDEVFKSHAEDAKDYYTDAYYKQGLAYLNLGEDQKAIEDFTQVINRDPNYREAYYNRGIAHERLGKYEQANKDYSQALLIYNITGHSWFEAAVHSVSISSDGETIASGSDDGNINLWNIQDGKEIKTLHQPSTGVLYNWIQAVIFNPDGKTIAGGSSNRTVRIWNVETGKELPTPPMRHLEQVVTLASSPDGQILASGGHDKTIKMWNWNTGEELHTFNQQSDYVKSLAFSPNGQILASGSCDKTIKLWDWRTGEELHTLNKQSDYVDSFDLSSMSSERQVYPLEGHRECVRAVAFSPDGQILASGSEDHDIILWDWQTAQPIRLLDGHTDKVTAVAISPNSQILASGSDDKTIKLWDLQTGREIVTLFGHESYVQSLAFSPNGETLVSGGYDKTVKVWQVPQW